MSEHTLFNLACNYAEQGLSIMWFRLDKVPGCAWSTESTRNMDQLKLWFYNFTAGSRRIGIKTGMDSKHVVVIDIDVNKRDKITGEIIDIRTVEQKKEYIKETYGELPETVSVNTPSGGQHLYYIADRPIATLKRIFPGDPIDIDSRGDGGVVIAPDEVDYITDGEFKVEIMSPLPEFLYEILSRRDPTTKNKNFEYTGNIPLIPELDKALSDAFMFLDYSDRDKWIKYGMAAKSLDSDDAKKIWMEWGQKHADFDPDYTEKTWDSFKPTDISILTILYDAKENGFIDAESETVIKQQIKGADKPRFDFKTGHDMMVPRPPLEWIVENILVENGFGMATGDAGSGKTWAILHMALSVCQGTPWLGRQVKQGAILIIDEESGDHRLSTRMQKITKALNTQENSIDLNSIHYITMQGADIRDALDVSEIENFIVENKIKLVIIDAFMEVIPGADENSVKDVIPGLMMLKQIIERAKTSVFMIHHNDKAGKGYRGSTAIKGAVDLMIEIKKAKNSDIVNFETVKVRDGEPCEFSAKMFFSDIDFRMELTTKENNIPQDAITKGEKFVLQYLQDNGMSYKMDMENTAREQGFKYSIKDICPKLVNRGYLYRVNAENERQAMYAITDKKKIQIEALLEKGYIMGNYEETQL